MDLELRCFDSNIIHCFLKPITEISNCLHCHMDIKEIMKIVSLGHSYYIKVNHEARKSAVLSNLAFYWLF